MSQEQMPPGWYYAQGDPPGTTRYWDGGQWTGEPQASVPGAMGAGAMSSDPTQRLTEAMPRIGGRVIDGIIWGIVGFVIGLPVAAQSFGEALDAAEQGRDPVIDINPLLIIGTGILNIIAITAYEVFMNSRGGTLGKKAISSIVVTEDGNQVDTRAAFMRMVPYIAIQALATVISLFLDQGNTASGFISGAPFWVIALVGLIMLFSDGKRQTPWDKVGKTLVVQR